MSRRGEDAVVIVTGGSQSIGRAITRELASREYAIVVVYLDDQRAAEATVEEILAAGGTAVAVRADVTDELDVERLFTETIAVYGGIDVVVHTAARDGSLLYEHASRILRRGAAIVSVSSTERVTSELARRLRERDIDFTATAPGTGAADVLAVLDRWQHRSAP